MGRVVMVMRGGIFPGRSKLISVVYPSVLGNIPESCWS